MTKTLEASAAREFFVVVVFVGSDLLERNGFEVLSQLSADGTVLIEEKTERILTIARKR